MAAEIVRRKSQKEKKKFSREENFTLPLVGYFPHAPPPHLYWFNDARCVAAGASPASPSSLLAIYSFHGLFIQAQRVLQVFWLCFARREFVQENPSDFRVFRAVLVAGVWPCWWSTLDEMWDDSLLWLPVGLLRSGLLFCSRGRAS